MAARRGDTGRMIDLRRLPALIAAKDWPAAERLLRQAAALPGASAAVFYNLAKVLEARGAADPRAGLYERAVAVDPAHAAAWFELGRARLAAGDLRGAEAAFDRAARLAPADADAWRNLVRLRLRLGDWAGVETALRHLPEDAETRAAAYRAAAEQGRDVRTLRTVLLAGAADRPHALKALTRVAKGAIPLRIGPGQRST